MTLRQVLGVVVALSWAGVCWGHEGLDGAAPPIISPHHFQEVFARNDQRRGAQDAAPHKPGRRGWLVMLEEGELETQEEEGDAKDPATPSFPHGYPVPPALAPHLALQGGLDHLIVSKDEEEEA